MSKVLLFFVLLIAEGGIAYTQEYIDIEINYDKIDLVSSYRASVTHTQNTCESWKDGAAVNSARFLLETSTEFQNQHIMGWGALNPWPDSSITHPANWEWASLDARVKLIRDTKGIPIITLCGCPTWMHTPDRNGATDWGTSLEKAPSVDHFDDFAHLCAEVARRYPDVVNYQVWNELKGFWSMPFNRWRFEDYTKMYNMVYDSLKKVNQKIKIGGPYPVVATYSTQKSFTSTLGGVYGLYDKRPMDVIAYWLDNKHGADFICVDGRLLNKDGILNCDIFRTPVKHIDIINWIRQQLDVDDPTEIWWSEWYANPGPNDPQDNPSFDNALMASALITTIMAGSSNVLLWQPEGDASGFSFPLGIWTSTAASSGGKATPFYYTSKILKENFSKGTEIVHSEWSSNDINVLASGEKILLVNHVNKTIDVRINRSVTLSLTPYEVRLIDAVPLVVPDGRGINISYNNSVGMLELRNLKAEPETVNYSIFNQIGTLIRSGQIIATSEYGINLRMLPAGVYIYRIAYMSNLYSRVFIRFR